MSDINLEGNVVEDIFMQAINTLPFGASAIARMIASQKRRKPYTNQQLWKKTLKSMKNMNIGKEDDYLKFAVRSYLQEHFGLPACDISAYDINIGRGNITLKFNPNSPGAVPFGFWMNKNSYENGTISERTPEKKYLKLTPEEVKQRLTENVEWFAQKEIYKQRVAQTFGADNQQISDIFKDNVPGRADFSGCEISDFDFSGYDLTGAYFKNAKLSNCTFSKVEQADLTGAVLEGCVLSEAKLAYSNLTGASIKNCSFDKADLKGCSFVQAKPQDVTFRDAIIKDTNLDFKEPHNVIFESAAKTRQKKQVQKKSKGVSKSAGRSKKVSKDIAADEHSDANSNKRGKRQEPGANEQKAQLKVVESPKGQVMMR